MINPKSLTNKITIFFNTNKHLFYIQSNPNTNLHKQWKKKWPRDSANARIKRKLWLCQKNQDKTNLTFLYDVPHMTSVLEKSGARDILFFFSKDEYKAKNNEIAVSLQLQNKMHFNLKSSDIEIKNTYTKK